MRLVSVIAIAILLALLEPVAMAQLAVPAQIQRESQVDTVGLWDWLFGGGDDRREAAPAPRRQKRWRSGDARTYRTLCVRLCDGFYFPISFSTKRAKFAEDADRCERQCPSRSRLYVYRNPGQQVEEMVDLKGTPYTKLPTALRFKTDYVADCTCRGKPWDAEVIARHESYLPAQPAAEAATAAGKAERRRSTARHRNRYSSHQARREVDDD